MQASEDQVLIQNIGMSPSGNKAPYKPHDSPMLESNLKPWRPAMQIYMEHHLGHFHHSIPIIRSGVPLVFSELTSE